MKTRQLIVIAVVSIPLVFMAGFAAGRQPAQRQIPKANVGQSDELLRMMDLTNEVPSTRGRMLRMRKVTLQPGGVLGLHNHVDRPAIT